MQKVNVKLKTLDYHYYEVVNGKRGFKKFLTTIGFDRTFKGPGIVKIRESDIKHCNVYFDGEIVNLDFDVYRDLVIVGRIKVPPTVDCRVAIEDYLTSEFNKLY